MARLQQVCAETASAALQDGALGDPTPAGKGVQPAGTPDNAKDVDAVLQVGRAVRPGACIRMLGRCLRMSWGRRGTGRSEP